MSSLSVESGRRSLFVQGASPKTPSRRGLTRSISRIARVIALPTLFDDGYVAKTAQIRAFPTTWFIDPDGRVQFSAIGNTGALVEEWSWRLEALRAAASAVPVP